MKFADLFCGIGGFHRGVVAAVPDAECVVACERNTKTRAKYASLYGITPHPDITTLPSLPPCDLVCGGFPCQSFSEAGLKGGLTDARGQLFFEIVRLAKTAGHPVLLLENVKHLLHIDGGAVLRLFLKTLEDEGYKVSYAVLSPHQVGVPQFRPRVFFVASTDKAFDFTPLKALTTEVALSSIVEPSAPPTHFNYTLFDPPLPRNPKSHLHFYGYVNHTKKRNGHYPLTRQSCHHEYYRIFHDDGVAPTLTTHSGSLIYRSATQSVAPYTPTEKHRLMGFPETLGLTHPQLGNAVCPAVVAAIVQEMVRQGVIG